MAAQLIGAERRLADLGRGRAAASRVQVGQMARRRRAPGSEAWPDSKTGRADAAGRAGLAGGVGLAGLAGGAGLADGPGPSGLAGRSGLTGLAGGPGPVRAGAAIRPGKGRHWGSISARRAWPLQRFNDICALAWLTWGK